MAIGDYPQKNPIIGVHVGASTPPNGAAVTVDPVTGAATGLQPTLRQFCRCVLPLNQSGGSSVLPTDYSPRATQCTFGASVSAPWANAGYFTSTAGAGDATLIMPSSAASIDLVKDSFIVAVTLLKAVPAGTDTFLGGSDGVLPGFNLNMDNTGKVGPRIYVAAGVNFSAAYGTATVGGATAKRIFVVWDAPTKTISQYIDGVLDYTAVASQSFASTEITSVFRLGRGNTGNTVAGQFKGFMYSVFAGSKAPINAAELAKLDANYQQGGGVTLPVFL